MEKNFDSDVAVYNDFRGRWFDGKLTDAHSVMRMVDYWARVVAFKHNCVAQVTDLKNEALISLAVESDYQGKCSLKGYVVRVLISKVHIVKAPLVRVPRKPKKDEDSGVEERVTHQYLMIDDGNEDGTPIVELPDERSIGLADEVLRRIAFDMELSKKIASLPELHRTIVAIVIEHDESLGSRRIAEEASKRLDRKVTRHQVVVALEHLEVVIGPSLW